MLIPAEIVEVLWYLGLPLCTGCVVICWIHFFCGANNTEDSYVLTI